MQTKGLGHQGRNIVIRRWKKKEKNRIKKYKNKKNKQLQRKYKQPPKRVDIELPPRLVLDNFNKVSKKFNDFRELIKKDDKRFFLHLNMNKIVEVDISCSLILAAELDCWRIQKEELNSYHDNWEEDIKERFYEMGLFELLKIQTEIQPSNPEIRKTTFLKFISGLREKDGQPIVDLQKKIEETIGYILPKKDSLSLYTSLCEAILNTGEHAYGKESKTEYEKWWLSACCDENKKITISLYDRGYTIPITLKQKQDNLLEYIHKFYLTKQYNNITEAAVNYSHLKTQNRKKFFTQTGKKHRGKGLAQLLQLIENKGTMTIVSNRDYCKFVFENNKLISDTHSIRYPLNGTLIQWELF